MRRDAVNISIRGFSKKKKEGKKEGRKVEVNSHAICMTLLEERTIRRIDFSLGQASVIKKQCMAAQLIRVNIKKAEPNQLGDPLHEMAPLQGCVGSVRAAGRQRAISCGAACRWSTAASVRVRLLLLCVRRSGARNPLELD